METVKSPPQHFKHSSGDFSLLLKVYVFRFGAFVALLKCPWLRPPTPLTSTLLPSSPVCVTLTPTLFAIVDAKNVASGDLHFFDRLCLTCGKGIALFDLKKFPEAGLKFERALRDARCIGNRPLEARCLENLATVSKINMLQAYLVNFFAVFMIASAGYGMHHQLTFCLS